jgi:ribosomal protein S18 acetylase RimI-like enzyme
MSDGPKVVAAVSEDSEHLADVLGRAFQDDPVSASWLPDTQERARRQRGFLKVFLDEAMATGLVHTTPDRDGVALWQTIEPDHPAEENHLDQPVRDALGSYYEDFALLGEQMVASHPQDRAHGYLQFIGVEPERQNRGIGSALIRHRLAELDAIDMPAYLESSSERNFALYERLGFRRTGSAIHLPNEGVMLPMWRDPVTQPSDQ